MSSFKDSEVEQLMADHIKYTGKKARNEDHFKVIESSLAVMTPLQVLPLLVNRRWIYKENEKDFQFRLKNRF